MLKQKKSSGQLRIIGGRWRGRKLDFPALEGLRPTPDRVRETLFNWLQPSIHGARCLDLFSGSGALGLEALSRGARQVVMVDKARAAVKQIEQHLKTLEASNSEIHQADADNFLKGAARPFDIVFLDPPYQSDALIPCCQQLEQQGWLNPDAYIYLEISSRDELPPLPQQWGLLRSKKAGDVSYHLAIRNANEYHRPNTD